MPGRSRRRRTAGPAHEAAAGTGSGRTGGGSQADLRARLAEMRRAQADGGSGLDLFGGAAHSQAAADIDGPLVEDNGHEPTFTRGMRDKHADRIGNASYDLGRYKWSLDRLKEIYGENKDRYATVSEQTNLPPELVAALHFRESSGDFGTYLHQGDPLGKQAVNHPSDIPIFHEWEPGAEHALNDRYKKRIQSDLGITKDTTDLASIAAYAEYYNGLGYHNKGRNSPYVYAGTDQYKGGKYVADGRYSSRAWDQQPGVLAMVQTLRGEEVTDGLPVHEHALGDRTLKRGSKGRDVRAMQEILEAEGHYTSTLDGDFGPGTEAAVRAFQAAEGLEPDGIVGSGTADKLKEKGAARDEDRPQPQS